MGIALRCYMLFKRRVLAVKRAKVAVSYIVTLYAYDYETNELIENASVTVIRNGRSAYYNTADKGCVTFNIMSGETVEILVSKTGYLRDRIVLIVTGELNEKYNVKITALDYSSHSPIRDAHVTITGDSESYEGYTDDSGAFTATLTKNVEYTVNITADGYDYDEKFKLIVV